MQSSVLVSSFAEIAREKGIDRDTLQIIVEDVFRAMIKKRYGADESFEIIFNPDHGDIQILHIREVVEDMDVEDPVTQIEASDAVEIDEDFEVGDEVGSELDLTDFGRRAVMTARQTFSQRIRDIEKENIYEEYSELVGEIVVGEVYQTRRREVLVIHNKVELLLPREEQIYKDRYRKGDMLRAVVKEVRRDAGGGPQVIISRADPVFMERLFELEVPEIYDGIVEIKRIVREPGDRAKVAVVSHDERVDPVGACVGMKGVRIHAVVRELANENIDVMQWSDVPHELIKRSLSPAHPLSVTIKDELDPPRATVVVKADEVSQAIGRGGINIRLASRLAGYELDVYREIAADEEDVEIGEFRDVFSDEIVQVLRNIGCDTAKQVLELSTDELVRRSGLDPEVAGKIMAITRAEFEEEEPDEPAPTAPTSPPAEAPTTAEAPAAEEATPPDVEAEAATGEATSEEEEAATAETGADAEPEPALEEATPEGEAEQEKVGES